MCEKEGSRNGLEGDLYMCGSARLRVVVYRLDKYRIKAPEGASE